MNRSRTAALCLVFLTLGSVRRSAGQEFQIGIIDFYGRLMISCPP